jgi:hypothetical protein
MGGWKRVGGTVSGTSVISVVYIGNAPLNSRGVLNGIIA